MDGSDLQAAVADIRKCESELRDAVLRSDVAALDRLLSDDLVFTDQDGRTLSKADDLDAHRSDLLHIDHLEAAREQIRVIGDSAIVTVELSLQGRFSGQGFGGRFAYTRLWFRQDGGWRVEAAHCSSIAPSAG